MNSHEEPHRSANGNPPLRILLVDDQALLRLGFRMILQVEQDLVIVGEASSGVDAVREAQRLKPDVILMDVRMSGGDGIEATRQIVASGSTSRIIILTTFDVDEHAFDALRAGASAFLLKDVTPHELISAVRVVAGGDAVVAPRITQRLLEAYVRAKPTAPDGGPRSIDTDLTPREYDVLEAVAAGLSNAEIATRLSVSEATIKSHVSRMFMKLNLRDRVQAVVFAYENGLVSPGDSPTPR